MIVKLDGDGPLNRRLYRGIREAIVAGTLQPATRLPSTRAFARDLNLSRNVVLAAFSQLLAEGYLESRPGSGTFVATRLPDPLPRPDRSSAAPGSGRPSHTSSVRAVPRLAGYARRVTALAPLPAVGRPVRTGLAYDFRYGLPAMAEFPQDTWTRIVARQARSMTLGSLRYGRALGLMRLRQAIADYVGRTRGVVASAEQVVIVNGSQQALDIVARLLIDRGDRVAIEEPSYLSARHVFAAAGARFVPVPVDAEGMNVARLPRQTAVRLAYLTPSHQFPLGGVLPRPRRLALLDWARNTDAMVIEDDYDSEFWYDGRPIEAIQGLDTDGRVVYIGTFSKVLFPSLRLGYLVVPPPLIEPAAAIKFLVDRHAPLFEQEVLLQFFSGGHFERHVRRSRARNAARRAAMLEAFHERLGDRVEIAGENAGIHMVVWLRDVAPEALDRLILRAADRGLGIYSVAPYYIAPPARAGLLLGYAGMTVKEIQDGVRLLADLVSPHRE